ncbi:hypothetical protein F2Q69_00050031 [Brassica cretica]|uniref:Uncharacterized protein n=1 Tax=Brassica cretica TaxID=69181 RepID=A0A8S9PN19_BRACR|nr:hypothetical protein F2Q69_00050031 [Brassica cretica]
MTLGNTQPLATSTLLIQPLGYGIGLPLGLSGFYKPRPHMAKAIPTMNRIVPLRLLIPDPALLAWILGSHWGIPLFRTCVLCLRQNETE